ncbi:hypothetical protein L226DRAFT_616780 [Lentinus tigrinus ALCF2SS1-7]|uniref:Uncharacterized protein n=1 Tax=Lentinus tigrinus ALCF2SS1-6 TaxID=1328759 RepID=A0A5C2S8T5_9APHY|nr:hypothetical protein L227DRAFT_600886 [Lentinus tigrinus ALCF2SS1-6]RPD69540.1 hypothetical protein L226DRAFT_616780 [Lentinus tigrinus ALCF2SS1-7]
MPQCQARAIEGVDPQERCTMSAQAPELYCPEHTAEAARLADAYKKAQNEADALSVLVEDIGTKDVLEQSHNVDETSTAAAVLKAYTDRLDSMIKAAELYQVRFGAQSRHDGRASMESVSELEKKRDDALKVLAKAEFWKSVLKGLEPQSTFGPVPVSVQMQASAERCQAYLETEGCTRCPDPAAEGRRFCPAHDAQHRASLTGVEKARVQCHEFLDDYEGAFGSGSRGENIKLLQKYAVSVRSVMEHLEAHQQQYRCKTGEQHKKEMDDLTEKRRKVFSKLDDLVLFENVVYLVKKAAPFCSIGFFVLLLCIVLNQ